MSARLSAPEQQLLERIREARAARALLPGGGSSHVSVEAAYRVQAALGSGRPLRGYKLGLLSEAKQRQMGIREPIYGRVYADMLLGPSASLRRFLQPRLEPELAVVLRSDVPPGTPATRVRSAFAGFFLALDVLDSVWQDYRFTAPEVVADNASGGGFALGPVLLAEPDLPQQLRLFVNGTLRSEGPTEALGDLGSRVAWLADRAGGLQAGQVVFLGSPAAAVPAEPGVVEVWGGPGALLLRFEA
jgi:2-keto-4-pentenoate hydratase